MSLPIDVPDRPGSSRNRPLTRGFAAAINVAVSADPGPSLGGREAAARGRHHRRPRLTAPTPVTTRRTHLEPIIVATQAVNAVPDPSQLPGGQGLQNLSTPGRRSADMDLRSRSTVLIAAAANTTSGDLAQLA